MFLRHKLSSDIVEVMDLEALFDPFRTEVKGRFHAGEEMQDPTGFRKSDMLFLSGEHLPRCWVDPHYKERKI
ncbi:MAG: hypothetical protein Q7R45_06265 [Sulfuricaulis sp.]|nr:hypothetical protein [Sulfuricaulis sp.]